MHLAKLRHGEGLILNTAVNSVQKQIVPLGIQILVENCIKHNIIEDDFPLTIDILEEDDYLIVKNNLQKKKSIQSTVPLGLENLKNRYSLLSNVPVVVTETPDTFVVKIPMLNTNAE
jgi:two-component system LytT family sensor kinase